MQTRTLGRTGLEVTTVGFGSITIGGFFGPVDDAESMQALHASVDAGIRFIDTSDAYGAGRSEQIIGRFLRERPDRDQIIICTKGGNNMVTGARNFTPDYIRGCLEGSLKRLGIGVIDVYLLHNPSVQNLKAGDSFELLEKFKAEGKIKHWGVSVNTLEECELAIACGQPAVMQMEYNLLEQEAAGVFSKAKAAGVGVISRVPLKRGLLSGRFDEQATFVEGDRRRNILAPDKLPAMVARVRRISEIVRRLWPAAGRSGDPLLCLESRCHVTIPGIRTPEQARANAAAGDPLPPDVFEKLRQLP